MDPSHCGKLYLDRVCTRLRKVACKQQSEARDGVHCRKVEQPRRDKALTSQAVRDRQLRQDAEATLLRLLAGKKAGGGQAGEKAARQEMGDKVRAGSGGFSL